MNTRIKRSGAVLVVLAITAIGIASWCLWLRSSDDAHDFVISTVGDAEEASGVVAAIKERFPFGDGNAAPPLTTGDESTPKEPTIYIRPGATGRSGRKTPHQVMVYRVVTPSEQEKIVAVVKECRTAGKFRPVELQFFKEERIVSQKRDDRSTVFWRDNEQLLRTVLVE